MSSGVLQGAHDVVLNNVELINSPRFEINQTMSNAVDGDKGTGIKQLLKASMPDAFYDSSARDPPPHCHPGTRQDFIGKVVDWGGGASDSNKYIFWMQGPAGVGKSAVAQSSAELLAERKKLGAAFFFSRPNSRDDPKCLFPSISYQITTMWDAYADILDSKIRKNPTIVQKSLKVQFRELLVKPLQELAERGEGAEAATIVVDGLDECAGIDAQRDIIDIIATSVRNATTPFRWALFSRPEPHIKGAFLSDRLLPLFLQVELPVSRKIDYEILCYLTAELKKIREEHGLPPSWPSERDLGTLVDLSAGLFVYASTVVRFVRERNSSGPVDQLCAVVSLAGIIKGKVGSGHPLSELDLFYTLIMRNVPSKILPTVQKILLCHTLPPLNYYATGLDVIANVLGLTQPQVNNACATLSSVLEFQGENIKFHHASFLEFMRDPNRSKEYCPHTSCLESLRRELLNRINGVHAHSREGSVEVNMTWPIRNFDKAVLYSDLLAIFFDLCQLHPLDLPTAAALAEFSFQVIPHLSKEPYLPGGLNPISLAKNIPIEFRQKIVRRSHNPIDFLRMLGGAGGSTVYVLGHGKNKVLCREGALQWLWC